MKAIKVSEFLKREIKPFLNGALINRIMVDTIDGKKYFYAYSAFRASKSVYKDDFDFIDYSTKLRESFNHYSGYYNWEIHRASKTNMELRFYIENDLDISSNALYKFLYQILLKSDWIFDENLNDSKKSFIRGFLESRGSVDTSLKFIAQDYFYSTHNELKKAQILTDLMGLPYYLVNFNPRNLQPQFVSGEIQRNAQVRINAFYYANQIGFINNYKALIFEKAYRQERRIIKEGIVYFSSPIPKENNNIAFIKYLNFFTNNIYQKKLSNNSVTILRKQIGFEKNTTISSAGRDSAIRSLFDAISEDKCAICGTTHTFLNKKTGKQYYEIHHVISYYNDKKLDNIANLVKLCPSCHDMMKKNRAPKEEQIKGILKILHEHNEIFEYTSSYLGIDDINELSEKIWSLLG